MLHRLPVEVFLQVTETLGPADLDALSQVPEFARVFHIITNHTDTLRYFHGNGVVPRDLLMSDIPLCSSRIYLIEVIKPELSILDELVKFRGLRKVISVSAEGTHFGSIQSMEYEKMLLQLLNKFPGCRTKFSFSRFPSVSIRDAKIDPKGLEFKDTFLLGFDGSNTVDNTKKINCKTSHTVLFQRCDNDVLRNMDLLKNGIKCLSINFADKQDNPKPLDLDCAAENVNLSNVQKLGDCVLKNASSLCLTFHGKQEDDEQEDIQTLTAPSLKSLKLVIKKDLPKVSNVNLPQLMHLFIDDTDDYPPASKELRATDSIFLTSNLLQGLLSLTLHLGNPRLLKDLQGHRLPFKIFKLSTTQTIDPQLTQSLQFENLDALEIEIGGDCTVVPAILSQTLVDFRISNDNIAPEDVEFSQKSIKELYPHLNTLLTNGFTGSTIASWLQKGSLNGIEKLRLVNVPLNSITSLQGIEFPDLEFIEVNGSVLERPHESFIDINAPKLETLAVAVKFWNVESITPWDECPDSLRLKFGNYKHLSNLIVSNFTSIEIRNVETLKNIYHGGKVSLQRLDADYLPMLETLVYKNLFRSRPIQSVQYINPDLHKVIIDTSEHPRSSVFSS